MYAVTCLKFDDTQIAELIANQNQILLLKIEDLIVSTITAPLASIAASLDTLATKLDALATSNAALTADAVIKAANLQTLTDQLAAVQADLATAQANAVDQADIDALAAIAQKLADAISSVP